MRKRENKPKELQIVELMSLRPFLEDETATELVKYYYNAPGLFFEPNTFFETATSFFLAGYAAGKRAERKRRKKA